MNKKRFKRFISQFTLFALLISAALGGYKSGEVEAAAKYNKKKLYKAFYDEVNSKEFAGNFNEYCLKDINGDGIPDLICRYVIKKYSDEVVHGVYATDGTCDYKACFYDPKTNKICSRKYFRGGPDKNKHFKTSSSFNPKTKQIITIYRNQIYKTGKWNLSISVFKFDKKNRYYISKHYLYYNSTNGKCYLNGKLIDVKKGEKIIKSKYKTKGSKNFASLKYTKKQAFNKKLKKGFK